MRTQSHRRDGFALAVALLGIVMISALIAGTFFASTQEFRTGRNMLVQERALAAAEFGQNALLERWPRDSNTMARGRTIRLDTTDGRGGRARVTATRVGQSLFWVVSEGVAGTGLQTGARRRVGTLLRLAMPAMQFPGALTTRGDTRIGGSSYVDGNGTNPTGWYCPPVGPAMPGIAIDDSTRVQVRGCNRTGGCVAGSPRVLQTPIAADTNTYFDYGSLKWADLIASADRRYAAGTNLQNIFPSTDASGRCNVADIRNWGEPRRMVPSGPCENYFPVIYAAGDLTLNSGRAQGILLVEGNLDVQGGFEFNGPVIVRGTLKTAGTGGHFIGGVMAANVHLDLTSVLGSAVISYSQCALETALARTSYPRQVVERPWADLF